MKKRFAFSVIIGVSLAFFIVFSVFAAFDMFLIHLSTRAKVMDWRYVENASRSVPGVERVEINREASTLSVYCQDKCTDKVLNAVKTKLGRKGIIAGSITRGKPIEEPPKKFDMPPRKHK